MVLPEMHFTQASLPRRRNRAAGFEPKYASCICGQRKSLSKLDTLRYVSCAGGKSMDPNERAEKAAQVAFNALSMAQAYGILVESLIGVLKDSSILNPTKLDQLFRGAAAIIDQATPADRAQGMAQANMRQIIERAANNAGIEIPPLGQTVMPRRH